MNSANANLIWQYEDGVLLIFMFYLINIYNPIIFIADLQINYQCWYVPHGLCRSRTWPFWPVAAPEINLVPFKCCCTSCTNCRNLHRSQLKQRKLFCYWKQKKCHYFFIVSQMVLQCSSVQSVGSTMATKTQMLVQTYWLVRTNVSIWQPYFTFLEH